MISLKDAIYELDHNVNFEGAEMVTEGEVVSYLRVLENLQALEEQGRLITLPCAVGSTIYAIGEVVGGYEIIPIKIDNINGCLAFKDSMGKGFYCTKEEAEAKLKELEGDKE